jgi:hypothetical protein
MYFYIGSFRGGKVRKKKRSKVKSKFLLELLDSNKEGNSIKMVKFFNTPPSKK